MLGGDNMVLTIECIFFCAIMFAISFLGTGTDERNLKSFKSYPLILQEKLLKDDDYKDKIKPVNGWITFIANFVLFLIVTFVFGIFIRKPQFMDNFVSLLILGEIVNLFDLCITDYIYFRNSKRVRFSKYQDKKYYNEMTNHVISFVKGALMFILIAIIDGALLMLF